MVLCVYFLFFLFVELSVGCFVCVVFVLVVLVLWFFVLKLF